MMRLWPKFPKLLGSEPYSPEDEELDRISDLVIQYEDEHYPIDDPDPASIVEFMLDQKMVTRREIVPLAGGSADLDAMLAGQREITPALAQLLHERSGIPVENLLKPLAHSASTATSD